jgi:copper chaperone CopZ
MKKLVIMLAGCLVLTSVFAQYRNIEIQAAGLTCSLCSNSIQKALKSLPFVAGVRTELKSNTFYIDLRPGTTPDPDMISRSVEKAGFSVGNMTMEVKFSPVEIKNDIHTLAAGQVYHFVNVKPQKIDGWQKVKLLDKGFVLPAEAKKNAKLSGMACYKTGYAAECCTSSSIPKGKRIYHVTI